MRMKNETLRKKLEAKKKFLDEKIFPLREELDMVNGMLAQLDAYEGKSAHAAQVQLGLTEETE